jgi:hypothetical protein
MLLPRQIEILQAPELMNYEHPAPMESINTYELYYDKFIIARRLLRDIVGCFVVYCFDS